MELKRKVVSGFVWHSTERFGGVIFQTLVSLMLARVLEPADFGLVSMLIVFSSVAQTIVDGGFSQALIRKQNASEKEYSSVFFINLIISAAIYLILLLLAHPIAAFYDVARLTEIAPYVFAVIPVNALGLIQTTRIIKDMKFKLSAKINLSAAVVSGIAALWAAYEGYGVWAIVVQIVLRDLLRVILMWLWNWWKPCGFSIGTLRGLFGFGSKMMVSGVVSQLAANAAQLFIGKVYNPTQLGLYYQSLKLRDTFAITLSQSVMNVSFPAFSELQDDRAKLREASRKVLIIMTFIIYPMMTGLMSITDDFFAVVLTEKWMGAVPYFRILCAASFFCPAVYVFINILRAKGRGTTILNLEFVKKGFMLVAVIAATFVSVKTVAWAMVASYALEAALNTAYAQKETGYTFGNLLHDSLPYAALTAVMSCCVLALDLAFHRTVLAIAVKIAAGAGIYILLASIFKVEAWVETRRILNEILHKKR